MAPAGTSVPGETTAPAPTREPERQITPSRTTEPEPISTGVLNDAALQMDQVPDHAIVADPGLLHGLGVDDGAVLNGGPGADDDRAVVGADDGAGPHARARSETDLADQHRFGVDVGIRVNPRPFFAERIEGHGGHSNSAGPP